jgi:hypothetical protein
MRAMTTHPTPAPEERIRPVSLITVGKQDQTPAPLVRVMTCGLLTLEIAQAIVSTDPPQARYRVLVPERLRERGVVPALTLLKLLVSRPQRFAPADWLREQFCRGEGEAFSSKRLDTLAWLLRDLLCPPAYESLRRQIVAHTRAMSGGGYQLAGYPLVWVDHEALGWNVEQAVRMERFGDDPLPFWQRADALARRGDYLPDEIYSEWADAKREEIAGLRRQSVLALARLFTEREGRAGEEEALVLLRSYWTAHPRDEDILRPLMELLGRRECYQEALDSYAKLCDLLSEDGQQPDPHTQDVVEYLRTSQIRRLKVQEPVQKFSAFLSQQNTLADTSSVSTDILFPFSFSPDSQQDIINALNVLERMMLVAFDPLKRRTLQQIVAAFLTTTLPDSEAWKRLVQDTPAMESLASLNSGLLEHFEHLVLLSRQLGKGGQHDITTARAISSSCLPSLTAFAQQPSLYQKQAADLAAQCYRLHAILAYHTENIVSAEAYAKQAVHYSIVAGIPDLLVTCLVFYAQVQFYAHAPEAALHTCQQAEQYLAAATPAVQSYFYRIKAACLAQRAKEQEALTELDLAYESFYRQPATEAPFVYAAHDEFELLLWDGITRYQINQFDNAEKSWNQVNFHRPSPALPERVRTGFLTHLVFAELRKPGRDKERCAVLWQEAMRATIALRSELRYSEVIRAYHEMQVAFPADMQIQALREQVCKWT